jgi:cytochrome c553
MGLKTRTKFAALHEAYESARSIREYSAVAARSASLEEAVAALLDEDRMGRAEAHLAALSDERKALKRVLRFAKKHGPKIAPEKKPEPMPLVSRKRRKAAGAAA